MPFLGNRICRGTFKTLNGLSGTIDIVDRDAIAVNSRTTSITGGVIRSMEGQNKLEPGIFPSVLKFGLRIDSADLESFAEQMTLADEQRYFVEYTLNGTVVFTGQLINDTIQLEDAWPYNISFRAIDGLAVLKNREFSNSGVPFEGRETYARILLRALGMIPTITFYDDVAPAPYFLQTCVRWYETQMPNTTKDPLEWSQMDHRMFDKRALSKDKPVFWNAWDAIMEICVRWNAQLTYWDNKYWFIGLDARTGTSGTFFSYYKTSTVSQASSVINWDQLVKDATNVAATNKPRGGGQFTNYHPLRRVILNWQHTSINYLQDAKWSNTNNTSYEVGDIDTTSGLVRMILRGRFVVKITDNADLATYPIGSPLPYPVRVVFQMRIYVGTYHLKRTVVGTFSNAGYSQNEQNGVWVNGTEYFEVVSKIFTINGDRLFTDIKIETPPLPDIGVATWTVDQVAIYWMADGNGQVILYEPTDIEWTLDDPVAYLFDEENPFKRKDVTKIIATNDDNNTREKEYSQMVGDEPNGWSVDRITVWNGSAWVDSESWQVNKTGTAYSINELLVRSIASLQKLPQRVRQGGYIAGGVKPYTRLDYQGKKFIPVKYEALDHFDEASGEFVEIAQDLTGITVTTEISKVNRFDTVATERDAIGPADYSVYTGIGHGSVDENVEPGAVTSIPITAAVRAWAKAGDTIVVFNRLTGHYEELEVTADLAVGATSISVSGTLSNFYEAGSIVYLAPDAVAAKTPRESSIQHGHWDNQTGDYIDLTTPTEGDAVTPPDPGSLTANEINKRIEVYRDGVKQRYRGAYTAPFTEYGYRIDFGNNRVYLFPGMLSENIEVKNMLI